MRIYFALYLCVSCLLGGCSTVKRSISPEATVTTPQGVIIQQKGDVSTPVKASTSHEETQLEIPKGSQIEIKKATQENPETVTVKNSEATVLRNSRDETKIDGPKSVTPPTQTEIAKGKAISNSFIFSGFLVLVSLVMFYTSHYKAGCFAVLAAFVVPIGAQFLTNGIVVLVSSILATISLTLVASWYLITHKHDLIEKFKK